MRVIDTSARIDWLNDTRISGVTKSSNRAGERRTPSRYLKKCSKCEHS